MAEKWEIIIVDDGSTDGTPEIAKRLADSDKRIRVITHHPNRGYGAAIRTGLENSKYQYIVFTDGDLQLDFSEVDKFIDAIEEADIVIGFRQKRRDKNLMKRLLLMYMLKAWAFVLFAVYVKDIDCAFKMFRKSAIEQIMPLRSEGAMITTEILAKAKRKNLRIKQIGVEHYPRKYGEQTGANVFVVIRAVLESLILWFDIRNKRF